MSNTADTKPTRPEPVRDREVTRQRLIQAVGTILAQNGFTGLGVNAVALGPSDRVERPWM